MAPSRPHHRTLKGSSMFDMSQRSARVLLGVSIAAGALAGAAWAEHLGWPWLVKPGANAVGKLLGRQVTVHDEAGQARIHLWRRFELQAPRLSIASPAWAQHAEMLSIEEGAISVGYGALWRMARGGDVHLQTLTARRLDSWLERNGQGQASWQFGDPSKQADAAAPKPIPAIRVDQFFVNQARIDLQDALGRIKAVVAASVVPVRASQPAQGTVPASWQVVALVRGTYRGLPASFVAESAQPWELPDSSKAMTSTWPLKISGHVGRAQVSFTGGASPALLGGPISGRFQLSGPSLAAVGEPLGLTLPTTASFRMQGSLTMNGASTHAEITTARIGDSELRGVFDHRRDLSPPLLTGQLQGKRLALADLGPAIGVPAVNTEDTKQTKPSGRMLPDRSFNLPTLAAMNADVNVAIDVFDTGSDWLQPMTELKGHITLKDSVLRLERLSTKLARGEVKGLLTLDGRDPKIGIFHADLDLSKVKVEQWITSLQRGQRSPYLSGALAGRINVTGRGLSTAELLSTLNGEADFGLTDGQMSHLAVELAGLDVMQGLTEWLRGDDSLPVSCARMAWKAHDGILKPTPAIVSTTDSTLWAEGTLSLKDETMDLRAHVAPKDFSLLTLRTPIRVAGSWKKPQVQVLNSATWLRILGAAALTAVNPLVGVLPLIDPGQKEEAARADAQCRATHAPAATHKPAA